MTINPEPPKPGEPLRDLIERHRLHYKRLYENNPRAYFWADVHALKIAGLAPLPMMIRGAATYADAYASRYGSPIGEDGVLGEAWLQIASGILQLLNGETGMLDAGATDGLLRDMVRAAGFSGEEAQDL